MTCRFFNILTEQSGKLLEYVSRYPARAAGWGYMPPAVALIGSGLFKINQNEVASGISLIAAGVFECIGNSALIRYGDPEISVKQAKDGFKEPQDHLTLQQKLFSPRKAPHEFSGLMASFSTAGLIASALAAPTPANVTMAASCLFGTATLMVAEKNLNQLASHRPLTGTFNRLAKRIQDWTLERPLRAAFVLFAPCNIAQMVDGWQRKDWWMVATGAAYFAVNGLRSMSSKRTRIVNDAPASPPK